MTEHDTENVRALFHDAQPAEVSVTRDLIGPAVAWGNARRRRDRITVGAAVGTLTVAAFAAVTLLPDSGHGAAPAPPLGTTQSPAAPTLAAPPTGGAPTGAPTRWGPTTAPPASGETQSVSMTEDQTKQAQQTWFRDFEALLPAGFHVTCDSSALNAVMGTCSNVFDVAGPTGSSIMRIGVGTQSAPPPQGPDSHEHVATTQIPVVSGVQRFPEGTVSVSSIDFEAQAFLPREQLTAPSEPVINQARYSFTPSGSGPAFNIQFTELFKHVPWAANISGDERKLFGYNPTGPVLSPEQFAKIAADPRFAALVQQWPTIGAPL